MVHVDWRDAHFDEDFSAVRDDYIVRTIGFVVQDGPVFLSIAQEILPDDDGFRAVTHIPKELVQNVFPLERGDG